MISRIHFIRHGITEGIKNRWFYGWEDLPLIEEGVREISRFKELGVYPELGDADCYTSGMVRADQTLAAIYGDVPFKVIPDLKEMNFGRWECKTFDQLKEMEGFDQWMNNNDGSFRFPDGESSADFIKRACRGLDELTGFHRLKELSHRHSGKDAVSIMVCHGGVIAAAMCYLAGKPQETFWDWIPAPGRGYTLYFENGDFSRYEDL